MGGAHQIADQTQEKMIPPDAHLASNLTFPNGLQTTTHRSQEMMVKDHRAAIPVDCVVRYYDKPDKASIM